MHCCFPSSSSFSLLSKCGNAGDISKNAIRANDALVLTLCAFIYLAYLLHVACCMFV